jgi:hypothetical protein
VIRKHNTSTSIFNVDKPKRQEKTVNENTSIMEIFSDGSVMNERVSVEI